MSGGVGGWRGAIPVTRPDRGRPPHIAPQNAGYLSQAATPLAVNVASNQFHEVSQCTQEGERPFGVAAAFVNQSGQMFFGFSVCSFRNEKRYRVAIGLDHRAYNNQSLTGHCVSSGVRPGGSPYTPPSTRLR